MRGRLVDAWKYTWLELWEPLEQLEGFSDEIYMSLFVQLEVALKERLNCLSNSDERVELSGEKLQFLLKNKRIYRPLLDDSSLAEVFIEKQKNENQVIFHKNAYKKRIFDETSNDPLLAKIFIQQLDTEELSGDPLLVKFFQNAYDVFTEYSEKLSDTFVQLLNEFICCHNLRYSLQYFPFKLRPHLPGVFASLFVKISEAAAEDDHLLGLMKEFEDSFYDFSGSHRQADMKECISRACMLVEGLGIAHPSSKGAVLSTILNSAPWLPHPALNQAMQNIYGFCCDYPGIRHAGHPKGKLRDLELKDSVIVPLMLLTAACYFLASPDVVEIIGINPEEPQ